MPIYEYKREDGTIFEIVQKITEEPLVVCPTTGQRVEKMISASSFILRGAGFYSVDYAKSDKAKKTKENE